MLEACKSGLYSVLGHTCSKNMETFKGNYGDNKIQNWGNNYQRERGNSRNRIGNEDKEGRFVGICIAFSLNTTEVNRQKVHICLSKVQFSSVAQSYLTLQPHESQYARSPCPTPTAGVYPNPCPSSRWYHPAISSSVVPFSSCPQSLPVSGSFPMSQLFTWGGQSTGVSASVSVLPMNTQDWSPLGWTGWISLPSKQGYGYTVVVILASILFYIFEALHNKVLEVKTQLNYLIFGLPWWRVHLSMQGTLVWFLAWDDFTCLGGI